MSPLIITKNGELISVIKSSDNPGITQLLEGDFLLVEKDPQQRSSFRIGTVAFSLEGAQLSKKTLIGPEQENQPSFCLGEGYFARWRRKVPAKYSSSRRLTR